MTDRQFTAAEKADAADREVRQRERVYPRLIAAGKMSQAHADRQLAIMRAIAADYREQVEGERLI